MVRPRGSGRDRHGRTSRADLDLRRRPSAGFRAASRKRFEQLVRRALARLPADVARHLRGARLELAEIGPNPRGADPVGDVTLASAEFSLSGPPVVTVYRRPLELRAVTRAQLEAEITRAVRLAVRDALGLGDDPDQ